MKGRKRNLTVFLGGKLKGNDAVRSKKQVISLPGQIGVRRKEGLRGGKGEKSNLVLFLSE